MGLLDTNSVLRKLLADNAALKALVGTRVYAGKLPEGASLPAVTFAATGGRADEVISVMPEPSFQVSTWADDPIEARQVYRAVYDALFYLLSQKVTIGEGAGAVDYYIIWTREDTHGIDLQDPEAPGYYRVLSYWTIKFRAGNIT
jgi:hypothetical protein